MGSIWVSYTLSSSFQVGYRKRRFPPWKRKCQNALSPEGNLRSRSRMGFNWFSLCFICSIKGTGNFDFPRKLKCQNALSPEGNLQSRSRMGSIWVSYTLSSSFQVGYRKRRFPPRKRKCQNALSPEGSLRKQNPKGSIDGLSILLCVPERVLGIFVFGLEIRVFEILKIFYPPKGLR